MKIVSIGLASAFTEGMTYQENLLCNQLREDGNEVIIISDCYKFENGIVVKTAEEDKLLNNGIRLRRMKYRNIMGEFISGKIRAVNRLYEILENEKPDIIFQHALQSYELLTVTKYKKNNPKVKLYVDSHEDFHNSATNFLSKYILHKMFYKYIIQRSLPYIDKVFCVAYECFDFLKQMYNVPDDMMEFYPLGGIVPDENVRQEKRKEIRKELMLNEQDTLVIHSGKMDKLKRTEEILKAFIQVPSDRIKLILIGSLDDEVGNRVEELISSDQRIVFLGWKKGTELMDYLCAGDLYIQPGGQSATMQNAICCGCVAALYPYESHKYLLEDGVFYIDTIEDMKKLFKDILDNRGDFEIKKAKTDKIAREVLDYKVLASRLYK
jgi:glycosyltransferase involved in cell wall biosynthesis